MSDLDARSFIRRPQGLAPADVMSEDMLAGIPIGREVLVSIRRPRNRKHHRLLFALLNKVVENTDRWANTSVLLEDLKLATGLFTTRVSALTGMPYPVPASISFASMNQAAFAEWFDKATVLLARDVLRCEAEALRNEVLAMCEQPSRRAA